MEKEVFHRVIIPSVKLDFKAALTAVKINYSQFVMAMTL